MANHVELIKRPNNHYELVIDSLVAKTDFTSATYTGITGEVNTYLNTTEGKLRLSGTFPDLANTDITWITPDHTPSAFDGSVAYKISFIDQSTGDSTASVPKFIGANETL